MKIKNPKKLHLSRETVIALDRIIQGGTLPAGVVNNPVVGDVAIVPCVGDENSMNTDITQCACQ